MGRVAQSGVSNSGNVEGLEGGGILHITEAHRISGILVADSHQREVIANPGQVTHREIEIAAAGFRGEVAAAGIFCGGSDAVVDVGMLGAQGQLALARHLVITRGEIYVVGNQADVIPGIACRYNSRLERQQGIATGQFYIDKPIRSIKTAVGATLVSNDQIVGFTHNNVGQCVGTCIDYGQTLHPRGDRGCQTRTD